MSLYLFPVFNSILWLPVAVNIAFVHLQTLDSLFECTGSGGFVVISNIKRDKVSCENTPFYQLHYVRKIKNSANDETFRFHRPTVHIFSNRHIPFQLSSSPNSVSLTFSLSLFKLTPILLSLLVTVEKVALCFLSIRPICPHSALLSLCLKFDQKHFHSL